MSLHAANRRDDFAAGTAPVAVEIAPACHSLSGGAKASSAGGYHYDLGVLPVLAADLPWARRVQAVAVAPFPGGRLQTASRLPGRRYFSSERTDLRSPWAARFDFSSERADRRSPWAARFDEQRGRPQAVRDLSRFRGLSRSRLLAFFAARGRSTSSPRPLSRGAVTAATSRGGKSPQGSKTPRGLTATAAHNRARSAGSGAARLADVPAAVAVSASHNTGAAGTTASLPSLARIAASLLTVHFTPISAHRLRVTSSLTNTPGTTTHFPHHHLTTNLRPSQLASAGTCRGVPAQDAINNPRPTREAGLKEEN